MNIKAFKSKTNKKERSQVESHTGESLREVILIKIAVFDVKPYDTALKTELRLNILKPS